MYTTFGWLLSVKKALQGWPKLFFIVGAYVFAWTFLLIAANRPLPTIYVRFFSLSGSVTVNQLLRWLGNFGPAFAAISLVSVAGGVRELRTFFKSILRWRVNLGTYFFALFVPLALIMVPVSLQAGDLQRVNFSKFIILIAFNFLLGPLGEEPGWRGYLLPRLQSSMSGLRASFLLGPIWAFWHLPFRIHTGPRGVSPLDFFALFCLYVCGQAVILTWLYNISRGSLLPVMLFHSAINSAGQIFLEPLIATDGLSPFVVTIGLVWAFALILSGLAGPDLGRPQNTSKS